MKLLCLKSSNLMLMCAFVLFASPRLVQAHNPAAMDITDAANRYLASLTPEQKQKTLFKFDSNQRENFHFIPDATIKPEVARQGLIIKDMTPDQKVLARAIPAAALSHRGYLKAMSITTLEQVLHNLEGRDMRNPELYYVSIFGTPDDHGTWGWRFEGHHLSITMIIVDGEHFAVTPSFFGTNPAIVKEGNTMQGVEVLREEEDYALELVNTLTPEQFEKAKILDAKPYENTTAANVTWEILTSDHRNIENLRHKQYGIPFAELNPSQQAQLLKLVNVYTGRFRKEVLEGTKHGGEIKSGEGLTFSWMGGVKKGEMHYYAIQSPTYIIEFCNSQNNANHIHSAWREFDGDFGRDFLREHYEKDHADEKPKAK